LVSFVVNNRFLDIAHLKSIIQCVFTLFPSNTPMSSIVQRPYALQFLILISPHSRHATIVVLHRVFQCSWEIPGFNYFMLSTLGNALQIGCRDCLINAIVNLKLPCHLSSISMEMKMINIIVTKGCASLQTQKAVNSLILTCRLCSHQSDHRQPKLPIRLPFLQAVLCHKDSIYKGLFGNATVLLNISQLVLYFVSKI